MKKTFSLFLIYTCLLLAIPAHLQAQTVYDYQAIDYQAATDTQVWGINGRGLVVGNGWDELIDYPFVYDPKTDTFVDVVPLAEFDNTSLIGISTSGYLVGSVDDYYLETRSGLILDRKGNATLFDHPDAISTTGPRGVNNAGLVSGFYDLEEGRLAGFVFNPKTGTFTNFVPSWSTIAHGINSAGEVVGSALYWDEETPCGPTPEFGIAQYGFLRTSDGTVTFFDVNGWRTRARGITDTGTIAGWVTDPGTRMIKGFVTEYDGTDCLSITIPEDELLVFPGSNITFVEGIKATGEVIGSYVDELDLYHGFIATPQ
jgi:hypothetical protein